MCIAQQQQNKHSTTKCIHNNNKTHTEEEEKNSVPGGSVYFSFAALTLLCTELQFLYFPVLHLLSALDAGSITSTFLGLIWDVCRIQVCKHARSLNLSF